MSRLSSELYSSFRNVSGWVLAFVTLALTAAGFYYDPAGAIPYKWFIPIVALAVMVIAILIDFGLRAYGSAQKALPTVLAAIELHEQPARLLLLAEASDLFGQSAIVSIFELREPFEVFAGVGYVESVREDKRLQIDVRYYAPGTDELWDRIKRQDLSALRTLRLKPSIPMSIFRTGAIS